MGDWDVMSELNQEVLLKCMIEQEDGVVINIEVTPNAKTPGIEGVDKWRECIGVKVRSKAEKGKANRELIKLFSSLLRLPTSNFVIVKGERSHKKSIKILGLNTKELMQRLMKEIDAI